MNGFMFTKDLGKAQEQWSALSRAQRVVGLQILQTKSTVALEGLYLDFKRDLGDLSRHIKWLRSQPGATHQDTLDDRLLKAIFG